MFEKYRIPGGMIGERSWEVLHVTPAVLELERQKIAARLEELYVPVLTS